MATILLAGVLAACSRLGAVDSAVDPTQPGPYGVALAYRKLPWTAPDGQAQSVQTWIWYPSAEPGEQTTATVIAKPGSARPVSPDRPFPLIVFSAGYLGSPTLNSKLISHLVSHGFVVAGPEHQDCQPPCTAQTLADQDERRLREVPAVLDSLLALNDGNDPTFRNLIDPARVGVAGQSLGGWTTLAVLERDERFRAGLAMAPAVSSLPSPNPTHVARPVMLMAGALDAMVPYAEMAGFYAAMSPSAPDHYLLAAQSVGHQFADNCIQSFVTTSCMASLPQDQVNALTNRLGTAFLLRYVAGKPVVESQFGLGDASAEYTVVKASAGRPSSVPMPRPLHADGAPPADAPGTVLLADDLSSPQGDHLPTSSRDPARYNVGYVDGQFEIAVNRPGAQGEALVSGTYGDASIAVDAALLSPAREQYIQLACRVQNPRAQYRFAFRPATGEYWLSRALSRPALVNPQTNTVALMLPPGLVSSSIHQGSATNRAELSCHGTTIEARINGETVGSVQDNTYASGQMWIAVGETPPASPGARRPSARFGNLIVKQE